MEQQRPRNYVFATMITASMAYTILAMVQIVRNQRLQNHAAFLTWQKRRVMGQGVAFSCCMLPFVYPMITDNKFIWRTQ